MLSITLIIGIIVSIFIVFCIIYSNDNQSSDIDVENKTDMLELMNEAKNNAKDKIKNMKNTRERFTELSRELTKDEANSYLTDLNFLNYWIQNNSGQNGIMGQINSLVQNANNARITNRKVLVEILTNMYSMAYLDFLNHQNIEAYKIYAKYSNPNNNKYYTKYLDN
jgi:hypothetical protein